MSTEPKVVVEHDMKIFGRRLRVQVHGVGAPVLLINGLGANVSMWASLLTQLEGFQVVSFDAPGTGRSESPLMPYGLSHLADVARRVLDELGHEKVDVLGYSLGGGVAQQFAHQFPERVRRIVLVSSSCGTGGIPGSLQALMAVMTPARHYMKSGYKLSMKMLLAPAEKDSSVLQEQIANWHHGAPPSVRGYTLQMWAFSVFNSLRWLHEIEQPTLVMSGAEDRLVPMANSAVLAAYLPHARLRVFEGWGHYLLHDPSSGAGRTIAEFLSAEDHEMSPVWVEPLAVTAEDMADFVRSAPRSAHPAQFTGRLVRKRHPLRKRMV